MQKPQSASGVRYLTITAEASGQRIDNYLGKLHGNIPRSHIYRIIRTGQVRVNGGRIKAAYKLKKDDEVRVPPVYDSQKVKNAVPDEIVQSLEAAIVYESDDIIALNKPAGLSVHGGSGLHFGVIDALRQSRDDQRYELVHRLDRGTSGCLVVGKHLKAIRAAQDAFRERKVEKRYTALVVGRWQVDNRQVRLPLQSNTLQGGERKVVASLEGKPAVSSFTTQELFSETSLMSIIIETGRTHQIRVHAANSGYAIVGDLKYGDSAINQVFRQRGFKRLYLHASELVLPGSDDGSGSLRLHAPLDAQWESQISRLRAG